MESLRETKDYTLRYNGETVADIEMSFLHDGVPRTTRKATWHLPSYEEPEIKEKSGLR